ncbi:MAG: energy-coupling factor ABC transporter permease, partial [Alistipes sp.]|nr:energy-coupling factor ABC transporter permease [Alistipes sp.]
MHMSDALISPAVAATAGAVSLILLGTAIRKVGRESRDDTASLPRMGVMGAFVFAAQLINFAIPGTGSSGHLVGGILLATLLGPWAGLLTLASVLFLQCLLFADGGFLALGCNLFNMAVLSCLVAWPTVYRPIAGSGGSPRRVFAAALLAGIAAAVLGALAVTAETELSGITALPWGRFLLFMLPIHLLIGIGEGLATAAVLAAVRRYRPELLNGPQHACPSRRGVRLLLPIIVATLLVAGTFSWIASSDPDGLEWSIEQVAGTSELPAGSDAPHRTAAVIQE